jgi:pullulanase
MDVVYNHVASAPNHSFEALVPGYYFRLDAGGGYADGTYCGNEVASDHPMARKYIVESVKYWASQYKLDGFRFDLMGILDIQTMNEVRAALDEIDPTILIIGEGWNIGSTLADDLKAAQPNITQLPRIGMFNDTIRDGIKGSTFNAGEKGWASGSGTNKSAVMAGIVGNTLFSNEVAGGWGAMDPGQSVNYVEAHDNMTLRDKLEASMGLDMPSLKNVFRLSSSIVLLAQGLPFIHAGQEFLRTKGGDENSYESGDEVNSLKWDQRARNMSTVNYFKGLIALRKAHPAFRLRTTEQVQQVLKFGNPPSNVISYRLSGYLVNDSWSTIFVVHNANTKSVKVKLPKIGDWKLVVDRTRAGTEVLQTFTNAEFVTVTGQSTFVLYK